MNNAFDAWQISHQDRINKFLKKKLDNKNSLNKSMMPRIMHY